MRNARPRFAIDDDGSLYDYRTQNSYAAIGQLEDGDGIWDLVKVKELIEAGKHIEEAFTAHAIPADKVEQATQSFLETPMEPVSEPVAATVEAESVTEPTVSSEPAE